MSTITTTSVDAWATRIRPHLVAAVENIIAAGRELIEAKGALAHGDFLDLVQSLDLKPRTAQKFMAIARNQLIANAPPGSHLPTSWTTLYELSRAPAEVLEQAIDAGEVTPDMSRKEALQLVARLKTEMSEGRAQELAVQIRQVQWEMGMIAAGCTRAGLDITCCAEMLDEVPPAWEMFGFEGPVAWLENCIGIFTLFPEPDFSLPWDEQQVAS